MNINLYRFTGDPEQLLAAWERAAAGFDASDYVLNLVSVGDDGITVVDVCPTEADFQGWINGDDWRSIKAELGGDVTVTRLGELRSAIAREGVVQVTRPHVHSH
jgi:hypothetical protein